MPDQKELKCCFCGRGGEEVKNILTGLDSSICSECVSLCAKAIKKQRKKELKQDVHVFPKEIYKALSDHVIGQENAKKVLSVSIYNHFLKLQHNRSSDIEIAKSNILMIGPTGCGKTFMVQILAKMFEVPFVVADATTLTEAGYVGSDVEHVLAQLLHAADYDVEKAEGGIICIDEIDKISRKSENASITRDVSGEGVQQALLKLMEGTVASVPPQGGRKHPQQELIRINTQNILFICSGSFDGLEKIIKNRAKRSAMGFGSQEQYKEDTGVQAEEVQPEDLVKYGLIPEFIGRLPQIVTMEDLNQDMLVRVLNEPKNSIIEQYKRLLKFQNVELEVELEAQREIAKIAVTRKTGARALKAILENLLLNPMFEIPGRKDVVKIIIDAETVKSKRSPCLITNKESFNTTA
tara:strand:- start:1642 stop:2868 length:1227 start_codon:yes stop_codon:yes gene_type:complete